MTDRPRVPYVGVGCVLVRDGRILLVRRQHAHGAGSWSTPGGHLDFGESPEACAARETMEETGIGVLNVEFLAITNDVFETAGKHYVTVWMRGEPGAGDASIGAPEEIAEVGWFPPDALPGPLFLSLENLLAGRSLPPISANLLQRPMARRARRGARRR